jgi:outer membrane protein assembly factor BamB
MMDKLILVGFSDGKLDAVDAQTGHQVWQKSIAYASGFSDVERLVDIDADPIVQNNLIYLASYQGYVGALSLSSGEFIWRKPASVYKNLAMDDNTLYLTDSDDVLWAYNNQNGQVKWKQTAFKARGLTEPLLVGQYLIVGDKTGYLHVLSTQNGELMSRLQLSGPIEISPAVSGKSIYVMTANGKLNRLTVS